MNLSDPFDRDRLYKKILKKDAELSKKFAFYCNDLLKIEKHKALLLFLDFSCNGLIWIVGLIALSYLLSGTKFIEMEINLLLALIFDGVMGAFIKAYFRRKRPAVDTDPLTIGPNIYSFPSGYSSRATLLFTFFAVLYPLPIILWIPLYVWWFAVCITRVILRKHHILDVIGGIAFGLLVSMIVSYFWIDRGTAISFYNWISEERTVGSDAEELL